VALIGTLSLSFLLLEYGQRILQQGLRGTGSRTSKNVFSYLQILTSNGFRGKDQNIVPNM